MPETPSDKLLIDFMKGFYGYGNPAGPFWFVGMEEGGGDTREEICRRLEIWDELGRPATADVSEFHHRLGMDRFFRDPVRMQPTWKRLICLLQSLKGEPYDRTSVQAYQKACFGRQDGETCSLELLPLPSPNANIWNYPTWFSIPELSSREAYRKTKRYSRAEAIRGMVERCQPEYVVCYGLVYQKWYEIIAGKPFHLQDSGEWGLAENQGIFFALVKHPTARGVSDSYFGEIGRRLAHHADI
ncbi:MAG: hypothetical protein PHQ40_02185 [Anaerolineaceae bacterium]|nr:hypothetical protein [Anaerolineaceae bacterium]